MKIGMMISPMHSIPPLEEKILAPWMLVSQITEELASRDGIEINLFAPLGSVTRARLYDFGMKSVASLKGELSTKEYERRKIDDEALLFRLMIKTGEQIGIEIYHLHQTVRMASLIKEANTKAQFVFTLHDCLDGVQKQAIEELSKNINCHLVSISNAQKQADNGRFIDTVYHGLDLEKYPFHDKPDKVTSVMGRIVFKKGQYDALKASQISGVQCFVVGQPDLEEDVNSNYWYKNILPYIDGHSAVYIPFIKPDLLYHYYQKSTAVLMPIHWEEPFGLVMIEAMACGTPVIAYNRGSVPEIVKDGVTGFIVDPPEEDEKDMQETHRSQIGSWIIKKRGVEGLVEAINRIKEIDRRKCRQHIEDNFTIEKMVDGYEQVYKKLLNSTL